MPGSDKVFELISSLSKGEKLNFKKSAAKHILNGSNSYIELFDYINRQCKTGKYNEEAIRKHFNNRRFAKNFSVMKSYLYESILKSLSSSQNGDAGTNLKYANILYSKGLNKQVPDILKRTKQKAINDEDYYTLLGALELEYNFTIRYPVDNQNKWLQKILDEKKGAVAKISNLHEYRAYLLKIPFFNSKEVIVRTTKEKNRLKKMLRNEPMLAKDMALTNRARLLYLLTKGMSYYSLGDFHTAYGYYSRLLQLIETTYCLRKNTANYTLILYNLSYMALLLGKFGEIPKLLNKFEYIIRENRFGKEKVSKAASYLYYYLVKLDLVIFTADFENYPLIFQEVEKFIGEGLTEGQSNLSHLIFTLSTAYFAKGDNSKALNWINEILNEHYKMSLADIIVGIKILSIFIHYELKNIEFLQYSVKSLYHYLIKNNKAYKFETFLIKFIRRLPKIKSNEDFIINLKILKRQLLSIKQDPFESRVFFEYFDYIAWIDSKIQNKPVRDIIKAKGFILNEAFRQNDL